MKTRFAVYKKGFNFPMFVFDTEEEAKKCVENQNVWSANFYYVKIEKE